MKTTATLITFDELDSVRPRPLNEEHCEKYMAERYWVAVQLVFIMDNGLSPEARESMPTIEGKDTSLNATRPWAKAFQVWRDNLNRQDAAAFNALTFKP